MKTQLCPNSSSQATTLLVTLFLCMILSVSIGGYMAHSRQQNYLSARSQVWNLSIAVTEAGVEEALQHLNANFDDLSLDGWTKSGSTYSISRALNSSTSYAVQINTANSLQPIITSQAFISSPQLAAASSVTPIFAAANFSVGSPQEQSITRAVRVRAGRSGMFLKAIVAKHTITMNGNGVFADSFDSTSPTNSDNGKYPSGNTSKLMSNGDVASNDSITNTIDLGNANVYGRVSVGPHGTISLGPNGAVGTYDWQLAGNLGVQDGHFSDDMNFTFPTVTLPYTTGLLPKAGTVSATNYSYEVMTNMVTSTTCPSPIPVGGVQTNYSYVTTNSLPSPVPYGAVTNTLTKSTTTKTYPAPGTYVGTVTTITPKNKHEATQYTYELITGYNFTYPAVTYTYSTSLDVTNFTVTTTDYDYVIQGGALNMPPVDYAIDSISKGTVLVTGNARLVVKGNYSQSGHDGLIIAQDGKLQMWVAGASLDLTGNGVMNQNGFAQNFICWCTDSVTSLKLAGNGEFTGVLVAPNADAELKGGGSGNDDFIGALIANSVVLNGHFSFHYDEALRNYNGAGRFIITRWDEVSASSLNN
jgi:hypothetical protein